MLPVKKLGEKNVENLKDMNKLKQFSLILPLRDCDVC